MVLGKSKKQEELVEVPRERKEERPASLSEPIPRETLNKDLQKLVDGSDTWWDQLYEGGGEDTTDSPFRYAAYANRIRTILLSAHRYVAYTSDIGESFRPVAHPYLVRGAYGISWAYILGDVSNEGYKAYVRNQKILNPPPEMNAPITPGHVPALEDWKSVAAQRAVFQSIASMGLPAFTIHSVVRYSGRAMKNVKNTALRTWAPIGLGLVVVPFLPYVFDKPVEEAVEWSFYNAFASTGGPEAVGKHGSTGRQEFFKKEFKDAKERIKEKNL